MTQAPQFEFNGRLYPTLDAAKDDLMLLYGDLVSVDDTSMIYRCENGYNHRIYKV